MSTKEDYVSGYSNAQREQKKLTVISDMQMQTVAHIDTNKSFALIVKKKKKQPKQEICFWFKMLTTHKQ